MLFSILPSNQLPKLLLFSVCLELVISQLSSAIIAATGIPECHDLLHEILHELTKWAARPDCLRLMAYNWCSAFFEGHQNIETVETLLFPSLEIGFRGLDLQHKWENTRINHIKHYQVMANIVFNCERDEVVGDLLQASVSLGHPHTLCELLDMCARHPTRLGLRHTTPASQRLRQLVIHSLERAGVRWFDPVKAEEVTALWGSLNVHMDDMHNQDQWLRLIVGVARSPKGRHTLPRRFWEIMVELAVTGSAYLLYLSYNDLDTMVSLEEEEEWDILELWMSFVWLSSWPSNKGIPARVERVTLSLFRQRPNSARKLESRLQRSGGGSRFENVERLRRICREGGLELTSQQGAL